MAARLDQLQVGLVHLHAATRILSPDADPAAVRPKTPNRKGCEWFGRSEAFDDEFRRLAAMMLRALERRRDRARERAALLHPVKLGRAPSGDEASERHRWLELERHLDRAHDRVDAASVFVHHGAVLLRRIRDDAKDRA